MTEERLTPRQAYNKARALEMSKHVYTTEGIHAVCSCSYVGTTESIRVHIEELAEAAGVGARENEVARRAREYEQAEASRKKRQAADIEAARRQIAEEDAAKR